MSARILDGDRLASDIKKKIAVEAAGLKSTYGVQPGLAVLIVGGHPSSKAYVKAKLRSCKEAGFFSLEEVFPLEVREEELKERICQLNKRKDIHGILLQLPLPSHLKPENLMAVIDPEKDVDGFHPLNRGNLVVGQSLLVPCTPMGIIELLKAYDILIKGKHSVIVGRSNIVGKPLASLLLNRDATVTICHSHTANLKEITRQADILVLAMGKPHSITAEFVSEKAVVVDVGFTKVGGKALGDAAPDVPEKVTAFTPVPGGVGPMTIAMLLRNTIIAAKHINELCL